MSEREREIARLGLKYGADGWKPLDPTVNNAGRIDPVSSILLEVDETHPDVALAEAIAQRDAAYARADHCCEVLEKSSRGNRADLPGLLMQATEARVALDAERDRVQLWMAKTRRAETKLELLVEAVRDILDDEDAFTSDYLVRHLSDAYVAATREQ
jgi:hypothetical protein